MALVQPEQRMTVDEFFAWDGGGHVGKVELVNGLVRMQTFASGAHGTIQAAIAALIRAHLRAKQSPCRVGTEAAVIPIFDPKRNVRKPDVAVTCAPHTQGERAFPHPVLLVEILSPSNADDTWESIRSCCTIPSVAEILVIDSERRHAEVFRKDGKGNWPEAGEVVQASGIVRLASIDLGMPIDEIYEGLQVT